MAQQWNFSGLRREQPRPQAAPADTLGVQAWDFSGLETDAGPRPQPQPQNAAAEDARAQVADEQWNLEGLEVDLTPRPAPRPQAAAAEEPEDLQPARADTAPGFLSGLAELVTNPVDTARDVAVATAKGVVGLGQATVGLADIVTLGRAGKLLEETTGFDPELTNQFLASYYSESMQRQQRNLEEAEGLVDTAVAALRNPRVIGAAVAESLPIMGGGAAIARKLVLGGMGAAAAGAIGEGIASGGATAETIRQQAAGRVLSPTQAAIAVASGAGTSVFGMFGARIARRLGIADVETMLAGGLASVPARRNLVAAIVLGAVQEGFLEEFPQSVQEQIAQNMALDRPWHEGVDEAAVMGTLAGVVMGGGVQAGAAAVGAVRPSEVPPGPPAAPPAVEPAGELEIRPAGQPTAAPPAEPTPVQPPEPVQEIVAPGAAETAVVTEGEFVGDEMGPDARRMLGIEGRPAAIEQRPTAKVSPAKDEQPVTAVYAGFWAEAGGHQYHIKGGGAPDTTVDVAQARGMVEGDLPKPSAEGREQERAWQAKQKPKPEKPAEPVRPITEPKPKAAVTKEDLQRRHEEKRAKAQARKRESRQARIAERVRVSSAERRPYQPTSGQQLKEREKLLPAIEHADTTEAERANVGRMLTALEASEFTGKQFLEVEGQGATKEVVAGAAGHPIFAQLVGRKGKRGIPTFSWSRAKVEADLTAFLEHGKRSAVSDAAVELARRLPISHAAVAAPEHALAPEPGVAPRERVTPTEVEEELQALSLDELRTQVEGMREGRDQLDSEGQALVDDAERILAERTAAVAPPSREEDVPLPGAVEIAEDIARAKDLKVAEVPFALAAEPKLTEREAVAREQQPDLLEAPKPKRGGGGGATAASVIAEVGPYDRRTAHVPAGTMKELRPVPTVELTRLAVELLQGNKIFTRRYPKASGMFYGGPAPRIGLNPKLGKDYEQFAKTLAHEIGHLVDMIPEEDLKRGNILGRIGTLRGYLKATIDALPTDPSRALTSTDRQKLRRQAENAVGKRPPKDEAGDLAAWKAEVSERYSELIVDEMDARGLIGKERVREELIALTGWWHPYDSLTAPESYVTYRESSREIYADAVSVLLNSPGTLQERAPTFFDAFLAYLERKPEVERAYDGIQELLTKTEPEIIEARTNEWESGFAKGEATLRAAESEKPKQGFPNYLAQTFVTKGAPLYKAERERVKAPPWSPERTIRMALQEFNHADNVNRIMMMDLNTQVHQPLLDAKITPEQFGRYLALQRIAEGDRGGMAELAKETIKEFTGETTWEAAKAAYEGHPDMDADLLEVAESGVLNPYGYTPEEAKRDIGALGEQLGADRVGQLKTLAGDFRALLFGSVEEAVRVGVYNRETFRTKIEPNKHAYATFAVLDYFTGRVTAGIRQQIGTVKGITNPYTATVLKTMALNRLVELQKAKLAVLEHLGTDFPGQVGDETQIDKFHREKHPERGRANLHYHVDGKLYYREVDEYIAKVFQQTELGALSRVNKALGSFTYGIFHPLYVSWSLGWQLRNLPRDFKRTYKNLSVAHAGKPTYRQVVEALLDLGRVPAAYTKVIGPAWSQARRKPDRLIRDMLSERALGRAFHSFDANIETDSHTRLMERYGIRKPEHTGLAHYVRAVGSPIETAGVFQETWAKAAGYRYLGDRGISGRQRAYMVRNYIGTPDSLERGLASEGVNSLYMYANVIMSGYRADAEVAVTPSTAAGYWFRSFLMDFAPKMIMAAAFLGWAGDEVKEWFAHIPDYDLEKYLIVPIFPFYATAGGEKKAIYLRLPHDDVNRVLAATTWVLLLSTGGHAPSKAIGILSGEFPGLNPALDLVSKWTQALAGRNPYDEFRGRNVVPRTEWEAGGWIRIKSMLRYSSGEFGILSQMAAPFIYDYPDEDRTRAEKFVRAIPGLSSVIKFSNRGLNEANWAEEDREAQARARLRAGLPRSVRRASSERSVLNRFGDEKISPRDRRRRQRLNDWYRTSYLPEMTTLELAVERKNDKLASDSRRRLERSIEALTRQR